MLAIALIALALVGCSSQNGKSDIPTLSDAAAPHPLSTSTKVTTSYHGCPLYASPNDSVINYNVASRPVEKNNKAIMSHLGTLAFNGGDTAPLEIVNLGNAQTPTYVVGSIPLGHPTPIQAGVWAGGAGAMFPWGTGFLIAGSVPKNCVGNCHVVSLIEKQATPGNPRSCGAYEAYQANWTGSAFTAYDGIIDELARNVTYISQIENKQGNVTASGIPLYGFTDWSDELGASIDHPLGALVPASSMMMPPASHTNYSPRVGVSLGTCKRDISCLALGDILRLKPTYACPPGTKFVCNQLKKYGAVITDVSLAASFRLGLGTDGTDHWAGSASLAFLSALKLNNFDVITREPMSYFK
jgi:hypothetical protein